MDFLEKYREQCYAALRIVSGFMFIFHGVPKLAKVMDGTAMWIHQIAGPIEVIGGALIMIGLYTSRAAFLSVNVLELISKEPVITPSPLNGNPVPTAVVVCVVPSSNQYVEAEITLALI